MSYVGIILIAIGIAILVIGIIWYRVALKKSSATSTEKNELHNIMLEKQDSAQKRKWADEVKEQALHLCSICEQSGLTENPLIHTDYVAKMEMDTILKELARVAELQGTLDSIVNELMEKGEA